MEDSNQKKDIAKVKNEDVVQQESKSKDELPPKPIKPEEKPFDEFINLHLIPTLKSSLEELNCSITEIIYKQGQRPVTGDNSWNIICKFDNDRTFCLSFSKQEIKSEKTIVLSEPGSEPSLLESFLIDEKKTTLSLIVSRILQRLNGQKWLGAN